VPPTARKTTPRKATPRKSTVPPTPLNPVSGDDDFNTWQDRQPVITVTDDGAEDFPSGDEGEQQERTRVQERPPQFPSRTKTLADRFRAAVKPKPRGPGRPKKAQPRASVANVISTGWTLLAQMAQPINLPVARTLALQAPVAGMVLEDTVKDTVIDRILQPVARAGQGGEAAFALLGPPLIVGALTSERGQAMQPVLVPALRAALRSWIKIAGPALEKIEAEEREFEEHYGQRIDAMIAFILGEQSATNQDVPSANGFVPTATPAGSGS